MILFPTAGAESEELEALPESALELSGNPLRYNSSMAYPSLETLCAQLSESLAVFVREVRSRNLNHMATDKWTIKEVLCHIVSWHEYYAANFKALSEGKEPPLYEGSTAVRNLETVRELRNFKTAGLIERLHRANATLEKSIAQGKVKRMTYKKGGRVYETPEFLDMISRHVATHTKQVRKASRLKEQSS